MATARATTPDRPRSRLESWTWRVLLVLVGLLPVTTSIVPGVNSGTFGITNDPYHVPKLLLLSSLLFVATALWIARLVVSEPSFRWGAPFVALGALAALIVMSTALAPEPVSSLFGVSGLSTGAVTWLLCIWMCVLVAQHLKGARQLRELSWALVGGCTAVAVIVLLGGVGLDLLGTPLPDEARWMIRQGTATVGNPDFTGALLVVPLVVSVALARAERHESLRRTAIACAAVLALACFVTLTRAAWLGATAGILLFILLTAKGRRESWRWIGAALAAALLILALGTAIQGMTAVAGRFAGAFRSLDSFASGRATLWGDALRIVGRFPWFGTGADHLGLGGFAVGAGLLIAGAQRLVLQDPHSLPLLVAGLFGIPALVAFFALVFMVLRDARTTLRRGKPRTDLVVYCGWVAGLVGLLFTSLLSVWTITAIFVLFLAVAAVVAPALRTSVSRGVSAALAVGAAVLVAVSLWGSAISFAASREVALSQVADPQAHLEQALELVPWDARTATDYYWRMIQGSMPSLTATDSALSQSATDEIDAMLAREIERFPADLMFYRLRMDLFAVSKGYPGYRPAKLVDAIDRGIAVFPADAEFRERRRAAAAEAR